MNTRYVCFLPSLMHPSSSPEIKQRDMQWLNITIADVVSATILDWYEDSVDNMSAIYQIAYDNFYTHQSSNVPWNEDGVYNYIHGINNDVLLFLLPFYDDMLLRPKPVFARCTHLADQSLCIEYMYNA